jgi:L-arabinose isomerase
MSVLSEYQFWFIVGSQDLYGEQTLAEAARHAQIMAAGFSEDPALPCPVLFKTVVRNSQEISAVLESANRDPACAGVITWMHTFSPSKMWIRGLSILSKPLLHLHTQFNRDIPWETIDMDFMNLNQSAHGDREHGFILTRMRIPRKTIAGHWESPRLRQRMAVWMRAAAGAGVSRNLRVLRISDNMREVAVTEGDKVEAHIKFGWQIDHYGVQDIVREVEAVTEHEIDEQMAAYAEVYDTASERIDAVRYQAREEAALKKFLEEGGFGAFHTNFQDLQGLRQLPGLACQDLMRLGYGFAGEGDWKTAAMVRIMKAMSFGLDGGTSFMEDYTYHMEPGRGLNMGAHMLEVCPSLAKDRPVIKVEPLGIGDREPPARVTFKADAGPAILVSLIDLGHRFRMIVNDVECVEQPHDMPRLPVAGVLWKPYPDLETAAEAWLYAGGAHHSVLSRSLTAEHMRDWARIMGIEFIRIHAGTEVEQLCSELAWNEAVWGRS